MTAKRPTMKDVAERAGVTQPTVSYVINGTANITEEVKAKVFRAIEELGYQPNRYARMLKTDRTNIIGIIIPDIVNQYYSRMVELARTSLAQKQYTILIGSTNYDARAEEKTVRELLSYHVDGMIVMYQLSNPKCWELLEDHPCEVAVLEGGTSCGSLYCINTDNRFGGYTATKYLLEQGRKRIAYVGQNANIEALAARHAGYVDAMTEYGVSCENNVFTTSGPADKWREGVKLGAQLAALDFDAIVVSSDVVAVGILKTLLTSARRVPGDVAVVGYDDIPLAELFVPGLTSVHQPVEQMCALAIKKVLREAHPKAAQPLKPELVIRETA